MDRLPAARRRAAAAAAACRRRRQAPPPKPLAGFMVSTVQGPQFCNKGSYDLDDLSSINGNSIIELYFIFKNVYIFFFKAMCLKMMDFLYQKENCEVINSFFFDDLSPT